MESASMRRSPVWPRASPADRSLAFQADVQDDNPQFPNIGAGGRYGLIQLEIHAQRISGEQAGRNVADINVIAGRGVSLGRERAAGGGRGERDALQLLYGYGRDGQLYGQLCSLLAGAERRAQCDRELFFGPTPGSGLNAVEALDQLRLDSRVAPMEHALHLRRFFVGGPRPPPLSPSSPWGEAPRP